MSKQELIREIENLFPLIKRIEEFEQCAMGVQNQINEADENIRKKKSFRTLLTNFMVGFAVLGYLAQETFNKSIVAIIIFGIIGGVISFVVLNKIRGPQKDIEKKERLEKEFEKMEKEIVEEIGAEYINAQKIIPQKYLYSGCVYTLYDYLTNGRADSLKEAINLYEEEQHRLRLEKNQNMLENKMFEMAQAQASLEARVTMAENEINYRRF